MAPLSVVSGSSKGLQSRVFDDIEAQFQLEDDVLHSITTKFLEDFGSGLSEYGHPMAMMCADIPLTTLRSPHLIAARLSLLVFQTDPKLGKHSSLCLTWRETRYPSDTQSAICDICTGIAGLHGISN